MPLYTVPMLRETFSALPLDQLPPRAQTMFGFSDAISANALVLVIFAAAAGWWVKWSLTNLVGPWRTKLDQVLIWRLYRDFQGAMFLAILSTIVKRRNNSSTQLPDGLAQLREGASPWMQWHIDQMSSNLSQVNSSQAEENSTAIANALNTGLIDQETFWYFLDVQDGAGIAVGLQKTGLRVEGPTLKKVARRAAWLRAAMIVFALLGVFGVGNQALLSVLSEQGAHFAAGRCFRASTGRDALGVDQLGSALGHLVPYFSLFPAVCERRPINLP
eukprot:gene52112-69729_t